MGNSDSERLVYSTDAGRICPSCEQPVDSCRCKSSQASVGDGNVRVRTESKGRKGKIVTVITGVPLEGSKLKKLSQELKGMCGSGGTVKDGVIEIQGNHKEMIVEALVEKGFEAKAAGGR